MTISTDKLSTYQEVLQDLKRLTVEEQLSLITEIVSSLRNAVRSEDDLVEVEYLAKSPTFRRLAERGLDEVEQGLARPVESLLSEL